MSRPIELTEDAVQDLKEARSWYEEQQEGRGLKFRSAMDLVFERIQFMPRMYPLISKNVRFTKHRRYPYFIYYQIHRSSIEIFAVLHEKRNPSVWKTRRS